VYDLSFAGLASVIRLTADAAAMRLALAKVVDNRAMGGRASGLLVSSLVASLWLLALPGVAGARAYAPVNEPGPALSPTPAQLRASLYCGPSVKDAKVEPVLLNPGTSTTPSENFGWNWEPALDKLGIPWCAYTAPNQALNRIDVSGEYLVYAIRTMYALAGGRIAIIGHSQGGMSMRWALRFWPDTRAMVADVVGLEPSNHGTTVVSDSDCAALGCPPADWQQVYESPFILALNSDAETFAGISYTSTYSVDDELVHPDSGPNDCSSCLSTGAGQISNVELQSICPLDTSEHVEGGTTDPVAYALGIDAITHPGPADPRRIPKSVCTELLMPGVASPQSAQAGLAALQAGLGSLGIAPGPVSNPFSGAPVLHSQPPLPCYVFADCPPQVPLKVTVRPARAVPHRHLTLHFLVTSTVSGVTLPVPEARVQIGNGRELRTDDAGSATVTLVFEKAGARRVIATDPEYFDGHATVTVRPIRRSLSVSRRLDAGVTGPS
jgi:pimeloyl-ACP methyl ester carboxylesterase